MGGSKRCNNKTKRLVLQNENRAKRDIGVFKKNVNR